MLLLFRCWGGIITWHKKMRVLLFVFTDCLEANMNNCMANDVLLHAKNDFHRFLTENKFQLFLVNNVRRIISQISNNICLLVIILMYLHQIYVVFFRCHFSTLIILISSLSVSGSTIYHILRSDGRIILMQYTAK